MNNLAQSDPVAPPVLEAALRSSACTVRLRADRAWDLLPSAQPTPPLLALEDGEWLIGVCAGQWGQPPGLGNAPAGRRSAAIARKVALAPGGTRVLRADPPMGTQPCWPGAWQRPFTRSCRAGHTGRPQRAGAAAGSGGPGLRTRPRPSIEEAAQAIRLALHGSGEGKAVTNLEVLGAGARQATVERVVSGLRLAVQVGAGGSLANASRQALGVFILSLCPPAPPGARICQPGRGRNSLAGFEVLLPPGPTGANGQRPLRLVRSLSKRGGRDIGFGGFGARQAVSGDAPGNDTRTTTIRKDRS